MGGRRSVTVSNISLLCSFLLSLLNSFIHPTEALEQDCLRIREEFDWQEHFFSSALKNLVSQIRL